MSARYQDQFLRALRDAGSIGVPNWKLSDIALQYNFEIFQLRKKGYRIDKKRMPDRHGAASQTYNYILVSEPNRPATPAPTPPPAPEPVPPPAQATQQSLLDVPATEPPRRNMFA